MNASTKRIAAIGSILALVALSGCASFDAQVSDDGNASASTFGTDDILVKMHKDSQAGGE